jgi:hypothetical protein
MMTQSLDRAFEGYSYTNREESILDSPPSELYDLVEPPSPVALNDGNDTRCFVYNESDDVIPYDDYADSSDDIRSTDLARPDSDLFHHEDYPPRPARPVTYSSSIL